jgi:PTH1 family peptidyl-tRNA hydrolase
VKAVVGLANPGPEYERTRHNIGAEVVAAVAATSGGRLGRGPSRVRSSIAQVVVSGEKVVLAVPLTYMNQSGGPVRSMVDYFGIEVADLLVVHDDIDLPFGRLRLQVGGGTGGHNGLRSVEASLATRDFTRLKFGVGRPPGRMDPADFVLRPFAKAERAEVDMMITDAADVVDLWVTDVDDATRRAGERRPI